MAYLSSEQLLAEARAWNGGSGFTNIQTVDGKIVAQNAKTGTWVRFESDKQGTAYSVVIGTPFIEPTYANVPMGQVKVPWYAYASPPVVLGILAQNQYRAGKEVQVKTSGSFTYNQDKFGGAVVPQAPPPPKGSGGGSTHFKFHFPDIQFSPAGALAPLEKGLDKYTNKLLLGMGLLAATIVVVAVSTKGQVRVRNS